MKQLDINELEAGLEVIRQSPKDGGMLDLIVCCSQNGKLEEFDQAALDPVMGLVGDDRQQRRNHTALDDKTHPDRQLSIMNSRVIALIADHPERWKLCDDQLYFDMDLSVDNLPAGTQLSIGSAIIEVTSVSHRGGEKFAANFGVDAMHFVDSELGKQLNLRGINAKVVKPGTICVGDSATKL